VKVTSSVDELRDLASANMLCVNGDILDQLFSFPDVAKIIALIDIFSRTSPN
jgi:hypothetical protein